MSLTNSPDPRVGNRVRPSLVDSVASIVASPPLRATLPLQQALANAPSGARIITIKDAGHAMMADAPDQVIDAIRGFLIKTT